VIPGVDHQQLFRGPQFEKPCGRGMLLQHRKKRQMHAAFCCKQFFRRLWWERVISLYDFQIIQLRHWQSIRQMKQNLGWSLTLLIDLYCQCILKSRRLSIQPCQFFRVIVIFHYVVENDMTGVCKNTIFFRWNRKTKAFTKCIGFCTVVVRLLLSRGK